jgi:hypothetical protein
MKPSPFNTRYWHIFGKRMYTIDQIPKFEIEAFRLLMPEMHSLSKYERMRSVGFCDRNGVEIYQKDYVKIFSKKFGNKVELVDWIPNLAKFGWGGCTPGGTPHSFSIGNAGAIFEVVGNEFQGVGQ